VASVAELSRRFGKDAEHLPENTEGLNDVRMIHQMSRRLAERR
jgi:hypothetical protein